jgi:hypothetical protein
MGRTYVFEGILDVKPDRRHLFLLSQSMDSSESLLFHRGVPSVVGQPRWCGYLRWSTY